MNKLLTMEREGEFKIFTLGDSHCGTLHHQMLPVRYSMTAVCTCELDERGFLFDQVGVDNYFQSLKRTRLSCERLTIACAHKLLQRIRKEDPGCKVLSFKLVLSPWPFKARMTYLVNDDHFQDVG